MADPLSAGAGVVGVAAFAQQLANSIIKIKEFCKDVQNAPSDLSDLLDQIERFTNILSMLGGEERHESRTGLTGDVLLSSKAACERALKRLSTLAQELDQQLKKRRRRGAIHAVLGKKEVQELTQKLSATKFDLLFAYTMYENSQRRLEMEGIRQYMKDAENGPMAFAANGVSIQPQAPGDTGIATQDYHDRALDRSKLQSCRRAISVTKFSFRLPWWRYQYAWDLVFQRASGKWTTTLTSFRVLSSYDHVWSLCQDGDIDRIREKLMMRSLSIHDRNEDGDSMFSIALQHLQTDLAKFLLEHCAEPEWGRVLWMWSSPGRNSCFRESSRLPTIASLRQHSRFLLPIAENIDSVNSRQLQVFAKTEESWTLADKVDALIFTSFGGQADESDALWDLLEQEESFELDLCCVSDVRRSSLLHALAYRLAARSAAAEDGGTSHSRQSLPSCISSLLHKILKTGADISERIGVEQTPFIVLLKALEYSGLTQERQVETMHIWLEQLRSEGVDLLQYGIGERKGLWDFQSCGFINFGPLLLFSYGSEPTDWLIWYWHQGDMFAGDFWVMLDHPELRVPGAWETVVQKLPLDESAIRSRDKGVKRRVLRRFRGKMKSAARLQEHSPIKEDYLAKLRWVVGNGAIRWKKDPPMVDDYADSSYFDWISTLTYLLDVQPGSESNNRRVGEFLRSEERLRHGWQSVKDEVVDWFKG